MHTALSQELKWRGFSYQTTFDDISEVDKKKFTFYWGVDPSSDSMTIGNLATAMMVRYFIAHGHHAVLLVGGATGLIGDPDGKSKERELLNPEQLKKNSEAITRQYKRIFKGLEFEIVDNQQWFKDIKYIDFLRDIGKNVPMRQMLGREFVQSRLGEDSNGISYGEFSYSLIQGYDFLHLFRTKGVTLQVCGSDQWGNSIAGVEMIRRIEGKEAHIWSAPLVVNKSTGAKFGKTEEGAVWLDGAKTSPYDFYQFWLNVEDENVEDYLKIYTLLSKEEIEAVIGEFQKEPGQRKAQKTLAREVTRLVHGEEETESVERITACLFGSSDYSGLTAKDIATMKQMLPSHEAKAGESLIQALVSTGLVSSGSEARRMFAQNAITLNGKPADENYTLKESDALAAGHTIVRKGKNKYAIVEIK
ncbi:MAG TPA: tyrosine--tRNA ligase [Candidatus Saccharimonadales bacterium]|nr:tyrosine--tRNA ligase [Candidatus Saccharimonadales bacterium]